MQVTDKKPARPSSAPPDGCTWVLCRKSATQTASGEESWRWEQVDEEIADIVERLQGPTPFTAGCCSGHGVVRPHVLLADGRVLVVLDGLAELDRLG